MTGLLIGGYGPDMGGLGAGIALAHSTDTGLDAGEVLPIASPSWVAIRGDRMAAALEGAGAVAWYRRGARGWIADGVTTDVGEAPCHLAFLDDDTIAVACYLDGVVAVVRAGESVPMQRVPGTGSGPRSAQEGPHAHHVHVLPDGRVLTLDLGADRLHIHHRDASGELERVDSIAVPAGTGPRDLARLPGGELALLGEWSCEVLVLEPAGESFEIVQILALPGAVAGEDQAAALAISNDGRVLFAGIRGADRVARIAIEADGLRALGWVESGGHWPRHLMVDGGLLHVANQLSDAVATFLIDAEGELSQQGMAAFASPTCVVRDDADPLLS
ncbi:beta-propeller fold lactonase family protein [Homoserinibacter sp. GY 40078]|uniref:lactonase family protein n=1 Tax=Homoserinibacter sp. GY 40078 TaxID=2603275 RepID=UPI0011CC4BE4|nr:beta-propeller fold lactonase family protein [Homoserinibacter sp. GY 40078]TXK17372.1 lactonase family protein [Homoserinibacter sp. GY 40078]